MRIRDVVFRDGRFHVGETSVPALDDGDAFLPLNAFGDAELSSVRRAVAAYSKTTETQRGSELWVSKVPAADFVPEQAPRESVYFSFDDLFDHDRNVVQVIAGTWVKTPYPNESDIAALLGPLLTRHGGRYYGQVIDDPGAYGASLLVICTLPTEGHTIRDAYELGMDADALLGATFSGGGLSARAVADLILAGRASALAGQRETAWLDGKLKLAFGSDADNWELAKDVAAFANTTTGGILGFGLPTDSTPKGDVIARPRPFPLSDMPTDAVREMLTERLFPPIPDIEIQTAELRAGYGLGFILVPPQSPERLPVMVRGRVDGTAVRHNFLAIPVRVGERTVFGDIASIHSLIVAGRAALASAPPHQTPESAER